MASEFHFQLCTDFVRHFFYSFNRVETRVFGTHEQLMRINDKNKTLSLEITAYADTLETVSRGRVKKANVIGEARRIKLYYMFEKKNRFRPDRIWKTKRPKGKTAASLLPATERRDVTAASDRRKAALFPVPRFGNAITYVCRTIRGHLKWPKINQDYGVGIDLRRCQTFITLLPPRRRRRDDCATAYGMFSRTGFAWSARGLR